MTITGLRERSTTPLAACSYLLILHDSWISTTMGTSKRSRRVRYLFIVGTDAATKFMSKAGFDKVAQPKEWFEIPGATHHSLYDKEAQVGEAAVKLKEFFGRSL